MIYIYLLGSPRVYRDKKLLTIERRTTRALFFYLAANEELVGRPNLCNFLWAGDGGEQKQRKKLRGTLGHLKKAISDEDFINTYHDSIGLEKENISVDLHRFSSAMKKMRDYKAIWQDGHTLPQNLYKDLVRAATLWRGSNFIDNGDMYISENASNWWSSKNRELKQEQLELFKFLAHLDNRFGKWRKAVTWSNRALQLDEYDEEAHFLFLRSLIRSEQREIGRQHFRSIEDDLLPEFDGAFSERICALGKELSTKTAASPSHVRPKWDIMPSLQAPFVGQRDAIQILKNCYVNGDAALILGEAGSGKTRLVQEFYESLEVPHTLLLLACHPTGEKLPYQPWINMLRREISDDIWQELPDIWLNPLAVLLPKLKAFQNTRTEDLERVYANDIVFEAIKNTLVLVSQKAPCILFVDNAQWADEATLSLLSYLAEHSFFANQDLSLVITSRVEETSLGVEGLLLGSLRSRIELIEMLRLNEDDISDIAFHLFQENLSPEILTRFLHITGGNPFFVLELLSVYWVSSEQGKPDFNIPTPESMKALIEAKFEKLSPFSKDILLLAAVLGNPFDFALLEKAANLSLEIMAKIIEELEKAHLIQKTQKERQLEYAFVHDIIRETLISSLPSIKSRLLHKKVAQALEEISTEHHTKQAAVLAELYEKAGDFSQAFKLWTQAGRYAYQLFSVADAHVAFGRAQALIPTAPLTDEEIYDLYAVWGSILFRNDNVKLLEEVMQTLLVFGEERGSDLLKGTALDGMSDVCMAQNQFQKGLEYTEEALVLIEASEHIPAKMNMLIHHGVFLYMLTKFTESQESFQKALALGEGEKDLTTLYFLGTANYQMAAILTGMGWPAKALLYAKQSLEKMRLSHFSHGSILSHSIMALAHYYLGNYEEGKESALESITLSSQANSWRILGNSSAYAGMNETDLATFGVAWEHAQKAIEIGIKHGHTEIISMGYKVLGDIYTHLDALPQAADAYKKGIDVDEGSFVMVENLARHSVTLCLLGDHQGDALLQQAFNHAKQAGLETIYWNAKALELVIFIQRGDEASFEENMPIVRKYLVERSHPNSFVWTDYLQALALFRRGETEQALEKMDALLPLFDNSPFFWIEFRALKLHIMILQTLGREAYHSRARLEEMLKKIESGLGDAPIQAEWKAFAEKTRAL